MPDFSSDRSGTERPLEEQESLHLGARLKSIREHNGLSQRELAKRAGVPHSSISMIEQGQNSPSINSLAKILSGIPMSLAHFFACDPRSLTHDIHRVDELVAAQKFIGRGRLVQKIPIKGNQKNVDFSRVNFQVGADTGESPVLIPRAISGFVIQGSIELTASMEVSVLEVGDAFSLGRFQPHRLRNISQTDDCVVLICEL